MSANLSSDRNRRLRGHIETDRKARHPQEQWLWREDWANGRCVSSDRAGTFGIWLFAVVWNAISLPLLFIVPREVESGNLPAAIGLMFPLVGVGLFVWALRSTARWRKFGGSVLELESVPVQPGRLLRGVIRTRLEEPPADGLALTVTCVRRIDPPGKSNVHEKILWQEEARIPSEMLRREFDGTLIPVELDIPDAVQPTDLKDRRNTVHWRVHVQAAVTGIDYAALFEVPMFETAEHCFASAREGGAEGGVGMAPRTASARQVDRETAPSTQSASRTAGRSAFDPSRASTRVETDLQGRRVYRLPAFRNPGISLGLGVFLVLWFGIAGFAYRMGAPLLFPIVFAALGALLLLSWIDLTLVQTTISIASDNVRIAKSMLGLTRAREIARSSITRVATKVGMSQQGSGVQPSRAYYDLLLIQLDGRRAVISCKLRNRAEAQWLAEAIAERLGVDADVEVPVASRARKVA
jgi:hypothetical protein